MPTLPAALLLSLAAATGCGGAGHAAPETGEPPSREAGAPAADGEAVLADLETRLLAAKTIRLRAEITSEGAVDSSLGGTVLLAREGRAHLDFEGTFEGRAASPHLVSDGSIQRGGQRDEPFAEATPDHLVEGLVVGLTRMGLLHNLARLCAGEPPDRTDGTVRDWVTVSSVALGPAEDLEGAPARPLSFSVRVEGRDVAEAALWLDPESGLPRQRWQTVRFEEGEMRVVERYEDLELDVDLAPAAFDVLAGLPGAPAVPRAPPAR